MMTTTDIPTIHHPLAGETLLSFARAAKTLPSRTGGHAHPSSLWRWSQIGARTPGGGRVRLERVKIGTIWYTSVEALGRFHAAIQGDDDNPIPVAPRTPTQRTRAAERAGKALERRWSGGKKQTTRLELHLGGEEVQS